MFILRIYCECTTDELRQEIADMQKHLASREGMERVVCDARYFQIYTVSAPRGSKCHSLCISVCVRRLWSGHFKNNLVILLKKSRVRRLP